MQKPESAHLNNIALTRAASLASRISRLTPGRRIAATGALVACALVISAARSTHVNERRGSARGLTSAVVETDGVLDSLRGLSRKLRARILSPRRAAGLPILRQLFGDSASRHPGVYAADAPASFHFITMRPFADKVLGRIGAYRIGFFPNERTAVREGPKANPEGFIEVTRVNQHTAVSEHFALRDFLTHDQQQVWPKYLVLREPLLDKLELVITELTRMGVPVRRLQVMSGFRTPQYNALGVGAGGRVKDSRHQYGDAADVYVVNGARDWMSDLNGDGRVDIADARVLALAADRVEQHHPELVGGVGLYPATSEHGPFVHIDVRGLRSRWGGL